LDSNPIRVTNYILLPFHSELVGSDTEKKKVSNNTYKKIELIMKKGMEWYEIIGFVILRFVGFTWEGGFMRN